MSGKYSFRQVAISCGLLFLCLTLLAQSGQGQDSVQQLIIPVISNSSGNESEAVSFQRPLHTMFLTEDSLMLSDYFMSIERVNDKLNALRDSAKVSYKVVGLSRRVDEIAKDIAIIRQNLRDKSSVVNIKNLYLYQSLSSNLDKENSRYQEDISKIYHRVLFAKQGLKTVMSDSVFNSLYSNNFIQDTVKSKLTRIERKWARTDSTVKANLDSLNSLKVRISDNSITLSGMLNIIEIRLDRAGRQITGQEINYFWQGKVKTSDQKSAYSTHRILLSELKAIGYYLRQTLDEKLFIVFLGLLILVWWFMKRNLLIKLKEQKEQYSFLNLHYLNTHPVLSLLLMALCLMPFVDAYAPTSFVSVEHLISLILATVIFYRKSERSPWFGWLVLVLLFFINSFTYLVIESTLASRLWFMVLQGSIIVFIYRFYKNPVKSVSYSKWVKGNAIVGIALSGMAIVCNLFGRFSLSGMLGIAGIFSFTQALILPVFIDTCIEFILLQLFSSRLKKGIYQSFDSSVVTKKIKNPLIFVAALLWLIMLTSNLNIYHLVSKTIIDFLISPRAIGSISFQLISLVWFVAIIWLAHLLQRLIGFLFGETGAETEDVKISKDKHSRLLITKLLVLLGGYTLAIIASGLPIDKLTIVLGALGIGIGMGLQNIVNNFVSGIILIFDGSLKIGDQIEINGQAGKVKEIGLRASTIFTADGAEVIIPNGNILSQNIINWTYSNDEKRIVLRFTLSAEELDSNMINEVINQTIAMVPNVVSKMKPVILYTKVTGDTCWLNVRIWSSINNADVVRSEAMLRLHTAFTEKNIGFK